ncbi:MAG: hypothetical protein WKG07_35445 [Hymenobacter sp.]
MVLFAQWKSPINAASTMRPSAPKPCAWLMRAARPRPPPVPSTFAPNRIYQWQKQAQPALPTDPAEAAEVRQLRAANRRLSAGAGNFKKAIAIFSSTPLTP